VIYYYFVDALGGETVITVLAMGFVVIAALLYIKRLRASEDSWTPFDFREKKRISLFGGNSPSKRRTKS
jgi:hypothetical protein